MTWLVRSAARNRNLLITYKLTETANDTLPHPESSCHPRRNRIHAQPVICIGLRGLGTPWLLRHYRASGLVQHEINELEALISIPVNETIRRYAI